MSIKVKGIESLLGKLDRLDSKLNNTIEDALELGCRVIISEAKNNIGSSTPAGKIYKRGKKTHRASAAGHPPAVDTGLLWNSFAYLHVGKAKYIVHSPLQYAAPLEFGTRHMAKRPFFKPALESKRQYIINLVNQAIKDAL